MCDVSEPLPLLRAEGTSPPAALPFLYEKTRCSFEHLAFYETRPYLTLMRSSFSSIGSARTSRNSTVAAA